MTTSTATATAVGLVARTTELDPASPCDLLAVAGADGFLLEQEGHGVAGRGEAVRIELPAGLDGDVGVVARTLEAIDGDDGVVALGALPFDRRAPATLVVPEVLVRRDADGRQWLTTVGVGVAPRPPMELLSARAEDDRVVPDGFSLTSPRSHPDWQRTIAGRRRRSSCPRSSCAGTPTAASG